ncbi:hypothetical protein [Marinimicrobium alkaliphilum]|uniref:hypothetical protein n=1 Tax=Marinimicrobium alkaliphilum TaxID=2202654 RepID=UPI000DBA1562|nr:hypothetical protein [Marinimicrobium alkaliphilum]
MEPNTVAVEIGMTGELFLEKNGLSPEDNVDRQPAGINFYQHRWRQDDLGIVQIHHGDYGFRIPFVLGFTGAENTERPDNGIGSFSVRAGITESSDVSHDEARITLMRFLSALRKKGWRPLIDYNQPRLGGEEAYQYFAKNRSFGTPADHHLTLEQWMALGRFANWYLYADDITLTIRFNRDRTRMDPDKAGAYLFSFDLSTTERRAKGYFSPEIRDDWQDLWADKIRGFKRERLAKEAILEEKGFTINRDYQDPIIHPADPIELEEITP